MLRGHKHVLLGALHLCIDGLYWIISKNEAAALRHWLVPKTAPGLAKLRGRYFTGFEITLLTARVCAGDHFTLKPVHR